jgi:hypothetical protein
MRRSFFRIAMLPVVAGVLSGCASNGPGERDRLSQPVVTPAGGRQSLALNSRPMQQPRSGPIPWYASRNEQPKSVVLGEASPTVQSSYTRTIDRLDSYHGEVRDHYSRTTYRRRSRQTAH